VKNPIVGQDMWDLALYLSIYPSDLR